LGSRTGLLIGCILSGAVLSQTPESRAQIELDPRYEHAAVRVLDELVRKYKDLPAYMDQGELYLKSEINGKRSNESTVMQVAFKRPDRLMLRCGSTRLFCDGREVTSVLDSSRAYLADSPPKGWRMDLTSISQYPGGASILGGISGLPTSIILDLLTSTDARKAILAETDGLRLETEPADSKSSRQCLFIDQHQGPDICLFIERTTGLVSELKVKLDPGQLFERAPRGVVVENVIFGWVSGKISVDPLDPQLFAFKPPEGYKKVATWDGAIGLAGQYDPQMNRPMPDFTLPVLDGPESTKPLRKADLNGKVVVIVFWTSWSPPCFDQLAWVKNELVDKHGQHGVVMLSVNIDDDAAEVPEARARVVRTLKEKGLALDQAPYSYVAIDPADSVGQAVHLKTIPTTLVLDRSGVVRFLFSGFKTTGPEPTTDLLAKLLHAGQVAHGDVPPRPKVILRAGENISLVRILPPKAALDVAAGNRKSTATIEVTFHDFPEDARKAFEAAVKIWESVLSSPVPIKVNASWVALEPGVLGSASPSSYDHDFPNAPQPQTWFPIALANKCARKDLKPNECDIDAEFSSTFSWYFGLDQNTPPDKYDFVTVVLHELGQGLGFIGTAYLLGQDKAGLNWHEYPFICDRFVVNSLKKHLVDPNDFENPSPSLRAQITGDNLFLDGSTTIAAAVGIMPKIYAPKNFQAGTSFSHLDEKAYPAGDPNSLMTPILNFGESIHSPGPIAVGILRDLSW
jgi:thiol-disulfide isomerase/thioredoxin